MVPRIHVRAIAVADRPAGQAAGRCADQGTGSRVAAAEQGAEQGAGDRAGDGTGDGAVGLALFLGLGAQRPLGRRQARGVFLVVGRDTGAEHQGQDRHDRRRTPEGTHCHG